MNNTLRNIITTCTTTLLALAVWADSERLPILRVNFPGKFTADMDYIQGTMSLEDEHGKVVELSAKFKTRGATALDYSMKPSFNMKLREADDTERDSSLLGLRSCSSWILDAMAIDQICMRNRVSFDIWNSFSLLPYPTEFNGRNGTVGRFVEVYINNEYTGIYCLNDRINRKLLNLKKVKTGAEGDTIRGVLYKHGTTDIADQNTPGFFNDYSVCVVEWHDAWELTFPEDNACEEVWAPLLEYNKNKANYTYIKDHFFLDNLVDYTLFVMALSIGDNWGNKNKYFSMRNMRKAEDGRACFTVTPWDLDTSFGGSYNGTYYGGNYSKWPVSSVISSASPPFSTCVRQTEFKQMLRERWMDLRQYELSIDSVARRLYEYCDLFYTTGAWQRQQEWMSKLKYKPKHCADLRSEVNLVVQWYQDRFAMLDEYFGIEATSIESVLPNGTSPHGNTYYDLQGRKITNPQKGQLYIKNKSKVIY